MSPPNHLEDRDVVIQRLREEIVGPQPLGDPVNLSQPPRFERFFDAWKPARQADSGEEILTRDRPTKRYGSGVLFPPGTEGEDGGEGTASRDDVLSEDDYILSPATNVSEDSPSLRSDTRIEEMRERAPRSGVDDPQHDLDISAANQFRPSVMAISFLCEIPVGAELRVRIRGGRYERVKVNTGDGEVVWWARQPVLMDAVASEDHLLQDGPFRAITANNPDTGHLALRIVGRSRPQGDRRTLITVCLRNITKVTGAIDESCLFQAELEAWVEPEGNPPRILPYPTGVETTDEEELGLELLYRSCRVFAVGHGCSADWICSQGSERASKVLAVSFPVVEVPNVTPEVRAADGSHVSVSMSALAGLDPEDDGFTPLETVVDLYERWIEGRAHEAGKLDRVFAGVASKNLDRCRSAARRMREGLSLLRSDATVLSAFRLANKAILIQQIRSRRTPRTIGFEPKSQRYTFAEPFQDPEPIAVGAGQGQWRPFQIAFQLMTLASTASGAHRDRELVELLWFPTGGGKTEAYLGLAAFSMFLRRLRDPDDDGVQVLMRYTLRLLTAQQFQRASRLVCAMEHIRRTRADLGSTAFTIGIWLGTSTTPNKRQVALTELRKILRNKQGAKDWLLVRQCPWCGAEMGVIPRSPKWPATAGGAVGYRQSGLGVEIHCPDRSCSFRDSLPIYLVDEDLYDCRPSLIIGTVDKFALLAWEPQARALFGIDTDGERICPPPGLVLQDELHLVSGSLGSMVGLYEPLIEELSTDRSESRIVKPKIVCSTATIRRFSEQVLGLYGRVHSTVFPPPALDAGDSFFSNYARAEDGTALPGRIYAGVHAPGLGSVPTAQVRTFSTLLQAPTSFSPKARDPWWSLLAFYNSLRELGTALSLLQSDIPDYLRTIGDREGLGGRERRHLLEVHELTGRLRDHEIPQAIELLERSPATHRYPVDVCLASNIIEVGIDIDRLSLMAVVGQPKTTSQYIQVTGRVGRRWWERPALVVTIYSPNKPRDRSHYEQFRSYHERLYSQVEPTSVTPLAVPALDRALHAVMVGFVRQTATAESKPYPAPLEHLAHIRAVLRARARTLARVEGRAALKDLEALFDQRKREWVGRKRTMWEDRRRGEDPPLICEAGQFVPPGWRGLSWPTPLSMRNVDAECQAVISQLYLMEDDDGD